MEQSNKHEFILKCRNRGSLTGIKKVVASCETQLSLVTDCGNLTVSGEKLRIVSYNENDGSLTFDGTVNTVKYSGAKQPLIKRIFK